MGSYFAHAANTYRPEDSVGVTPDESHFSTDSHGNLIKIL